MSLEKGKCIQSPSKKQRRNTWWTTGWPPSPQSPEKLQNKSSWKPLPSTTAARWLGTASTICKRQIIPDKSAICSEMTGSKHKESTGNAVYLSVCKVFNAVSQYCLCLIGGMCSLQDGWEIICITRLKEKLLILPSLTGIPHGLTTMLLQMPFLRGWQWDLHDLTSTPWTTEQNVLLASLLRL